MGKTVTKQIDEIEPLRFGYVKRMETSEIARKVYEKGCVGICSADAQQIR